MPGETVFAPPPAASASAKRKRDQALRKGLAAASGTPTAPSGKTFVACFQRAPVTNEIASIAEVESQEGEGAGRASEPAQPSPTTEAEDRIAGALLNLPAETTAEQLEQLLNDLLQQQDDPLPYSFWIEQTQVTQSLEETVTAMGQTSSEHMLTIHYVPQAIFKVRSINRCSSSLVGHAEAILCLSFSPSGKQLVSGSGDSTARIWDLNTETPQHTLKGHTNWVQIVTWSPDCRFIATGSMDTTIRLWCGKTGKALGEPLRAHKQSITSIAWEPMHANVKCNRFVSSSRDATIRVWDATLRKNAFCMTSHTAPVTCVKWGGEGLIYSASRDKTIKVWSGTDGKLIRTLDGHAHWVNHLALSTDFINRTGPYDHTGPTFPDAQSAHEAAKTRYQHHVHTHGPERLASCSDDHTLFLWDPLTSKKPIARMTGHQQLVNHIAFAPDGRTLASASFDKAVKLWDGVTGAFRVNCRGHVGSVYQVTFSSDSRQALSASKDSTVMAWDLKSGKLRNELPGHADEVYAVDWSPQGDKVASGGKDKILKIWRH